MPLYSPRCIFIWHDWQTGICFRFNIAISLVKPFCFGSIPFFKCLTWWISISCSYPQIQQESSKLECVFSLQFSTSNRSVQLVLRWKFRLFVDLSSILNLMGFSFSASGEASLGPNRISWTLLFCFWALVFWLKSWHRNVVVWSL